MVRTTPVHRSLVHQSWHVFQRGLCAYCGWYCDDCPNDVATCKCKSSLTKEELADMRLKQAALDHDDSWRE